MNDLGWAIEHTVRGADERPFDCYFAAAQQPPPLVLTPPADDGSTVRYLLETDTPLYCFALQPDSSGQPILNLLIVQQADTNGQLPDVSLVSSAGVVAG